jgi:hypothetical protein
MHLPFWSDAQQQMATLSTNGHLNVVAGSKHNIHWDHPAVVIDTVRQVVAQVRGQ